MAMQSAAIDAAKSGTRALVAAQGAGTQIRVFGLYLSGSAGDGTAVVQDGAGTPVAMTGTLTFDIDAAPNVFLMSSSPKIPLFTATANMAVNVVLSANLDMDGFIVYDVVDGNPY